MTLLKPFCRHACGGTERPPWDSPAHFGTTIDGRRTVWCPCCNSELTEVAAGSAEAPNIISAIDQRDRRRMVDSVCGYEVVVLRELRAKA